MYDQIQLITKTFERRIYLANQFYEQAIRRAHNEYYDSLNNLMAPQVTPGPAPILPNFGKSNPQPEIKEPEVETEVNINEEPVANEPEPIKEPEVPEFDKIIDLIFSHYDPPTSKSTN